MKNSKKPISQAYYVLITLFAFFAASPVFAYNVMGGAMTININNTDLAAAFTHNDDPSRPSFYLEEYFDSAQAASRTPDQILTDHIVPGTSEISGSALQLTVNDSTTSYPNIPTTFSFSPNDLTGTASGSIGLGGALRYRLNVPFNINPVTGEEEGNRTVTGYFGLEYDDSRVDVAAGHSGWALFNHHSFRADVFDLDNVTTNLTGDSLTLSGDLALATGFNHLGGQNEAIVGDFSFQTTVVPVPAAVWLFASGLTGFFITSRTNRKATS